MTRAIALLRDAITKEDALPYDEPPEWFVPTRHYLGAVLLQAGKPTDAEAVYREDLNQNKDNGWALFGLHQALVAQKKKKEAAGIQKRLAKVWSQADTKLTTSAF